MYEYDCQKNKNKTHDYENISSTGAKLPDVTVHLENPHLKSLNPDILYHLNLDTTQDLEKMFGDVKFVCMGGTPKRMKEFADYIMEEINFILPTGTQLQDICMHSYRYSLYKIGPVLSASHGVGVPSISILLHEIIKLVHHAKCKDPIFFRLGTCGGIGLAGGTVIISDEAVDGMCNKYYELPILGKLVQKPCVFDKDLIEELKSLAVPNSSYEVVTGKTLCALDFYEGQARLDGAFCDYTQEDKMSYLEQLQGNGIKNFEMESVSFGALTHQAGIKAAVVCVSLLDRLQSDQITISNEIFKEWEKRPQELIGRYIKKALTII